MADIINVDFRKTRTVTSRVTEQEQRQAAEERNKPLLARNKALINDMKAFLDEHADQLDLSRAVVFMPGDDLDLYAKFNGGDLDMSDLQAVSRIINKLGRSNHARV